MRKIKIGRALIGVDCEPFIIAEMSGNHNQSLDRALAIVEAVARTGAGALKLQTYTADTMTLDINKREFFIRESKSLWKGKSLYKLYQKAHTPWEWHKPILKHCRELGLIGFSTPFDETAVDFLESLNIPCYKIASFELVDLPLIKKVALTGKPVILSTGMASELEISEAVQVVREAGNHDIILLKCTSSYPANPQDSNISTITDMQKKFNCQIGLSDHTLGIGAAVASIALGATVIEKHITLSRADGGVDSDFSMEPHEMRDLVVETKKAWQSLGQTNYGSTQCEMQSLRYRRSLYIVKDMKKGDVFSKENLKSIRPGFGLPPKLYDKILGKKINRAASRGAPVKWEMVSTEGAADII